MCPSFCASSFQVREARTLGCLRFFSVVLSSFRICMVWLLLCPIWIELKHGLVLGFGCCTRKQWRVLVFSPKRASLA